MSKAKLSAKNLAVIRVLTRANKEVQKSLLCNASKDFISCLISCINAILKGKVPIKNSQLSRLRPFEKKLQKLISSKTPLVEKRSLIESEASQKGGLFGALVPILKGVLGALI